MARPPVIDSARERKKKLKKKKNEAGRQSDEAEHATIHWRAYDTAIATNARVRVVKRCEERKERPVSSPPHAIAPHAGVAARALPVAYQLYFLGAVGGGGGGTPTRMSRGTMAAGEPVFPRARICVGGAGTRHNTSSAADGNTLERAAPH